MDKCVGTWKYCDGYENMLSCANRVGSKLFMCDGQVCSGAPGPAACYDNDYLVKCIFDDNDDNVMISVIGYGVYTHAMRVVFYKVIMIIEHVQRST